MIASILPAAGDLLASVCLLCAAIPAAMFIRNASRFRVPPPVPPDPPVPKASLLIPARNEATAIGRALRAALASEGVEFEVVVLDDESDDGTADIVAGIAAEDPRVRLVAGRPLPPGWCGKQHACATLAAESRHEHLVFIDADVEITPDCLARSIAFLHSSGAALASGFPRQETSTFLDWLLLPLIHFVLLGYLPLERSRRSTDPALAAGCGQLFLTRRADYDRSGGHAAIRASLHDGLKLPRAYRKAGLATDVFDACGLASCRMYDRGIDVLRGLSKNATEGIASPRTILPATALLLFGQLLPLPVAATAIIGAWPSPSTWLAGLAVACSYLPRVAAAIRFRGSLASAAVHPLAVAVFLGIQWWAAARKAIGRPTQWRGRSLAPQQ